MKNIFEGEDAGAALDRIAKELMHASPREISYTESFHRVVANPEHKKLVDQYYQIGEHAPK